MFRWIFQNKKRSIIFFIVTGVFVRIAYSLITYKESHLLMPDSYGYDKISNLLLKGDFNFDRDNFISAPFLPFFLFVLKSFFSAGWINALIILQILISSATVYYVWQLSELVFRSQRVAICASVFYTFYPPLFYFVHTIAQETTFLFFLTAFVFYFVRYLIRCIKKDILLAALFFTAAYLTKSFISLYVPFIVILIIYLCQTITLRQRIVSVVQFFLVVLVFVIPVGINNYNHHKVFVTSSDGGGLIFFAANSDLNYIDLTNTPLGGSKPFEPGKAPLMTFDFFPNPAYDSIMLLPVKDKPAAFWREGFNWIQANPGKFLEIRGMNLMRLIIPGNSWNRYSFSQWFVSFMVACPLYVLAYFGIVKALKADWKRHLWLIALIAAFSIMHILFIFTNRYRTFTFDVFYGIYAAFAFDFVLSKIKKLRAVQP